MPKIESDGIPSFSLEELKDIKENGFCTGCLAEPRRRGSAYGELCAARHRSGLPPLLFKPKK